MGGFLTHPRVLSLSGNRTLPTAVPGVRLRVGRGESHATLVQRGKESPIPYASDQLQFFLDLAREAGGLVRLRLAWLAWVVVASYMGAITSMKC